MRVEIKKPDTVQFCIWMDKEDELYGRCMWARVTFDNINWSMMAQSDCGDYSYSWSPEINRTFLQLMQQIDGQYLLGKVADRTRFDEEASKGNLIMWVAEDGDSERMIAEINEIRTNSAHEFIREVEEIAGMDEYSDLWECIESDYPQSAKVFSELFVKCVQPEIRKYLRGCN
ncbi:MAG: hypothetical protein ACRDBO_00095 [Lachnospiraceae bacterium]